LEEVLGTLVQGAVSFPDPAVQKLCFGVLKRLIDLWAQEGVMPGFVDYMYKNILPACFLAPLKSTFDLNDGNTYVVFIKNIQELQPKPLRQYFKSLYEELRTVQSHTHS
jgi:hypothetical protein